MKLTTEQLEKFAKEINKDWIGGYSADVSENHLSDLTLNISLYGKTVLWLTEDGDFLGDDDHAEEQIKYMLNR